MSNENSPQTISLSDETIDRLAKAIAREMRTEVTNPTQQTEQLFTTEEAAAFVKQPSPNAFRAWARRYKVDRSGNNRWSRDRLEIGIQNEKRHRIMG